MYLPVYRLDNTLVYHFLALVASRYNIHITQMHFHFFFVYQVSIVLIPQNTSIHGIIDT